MINFLSLALFLSTLKPMLMVTPVLSRAVDIGDIAGIIWNNLELSKLSISEP
jgi:hypothetical protein